MNPRIPDLGARGVGSGKAGCREAGDAEGESEVAAEVNGGGRGPPTRTRAWLRVLAACASPRPLGNSATALRFPARAARASGAHHLAADVRQN